MTESETSLLPDELVDRLRRLDWRVRGLAVMRGVGLVVAVAGTGVAVGLLIDWLWGVGGTTRTALLLGMLAASLVTLLWAVIVPLFRRISDAELAAIVDTAYPELGERVEAAVELSDPAVQESHRGSTVMRRRLMRDVIRRTDKVDFAGAAESSSAMRWLGIGGLTLLLLLAPLGLSREGYGLLLTRYFSPWKNVERASNLFLVIENGDRTVARGTDVTITAEPRWRLVAGTLPEYAWLHWQNADGEADERRMEFDASAHAYVATLPDVLTSIDYDVSAGSAHTRSFHIDVVEAPDIERLFIEIEPPAYTRLPARSVEGPIGPIDVFERSVLDFTIDFTKPVESAELVWQTDAHSPDDANDTDEPASLPCTLSEDGRSATLALTAEHGGPFVIRLLDEHGVSNPQRDPWELWVLADAPPLIEWADEDRLAVTANATIEVQPTGQLPLTVVAEDDVGVAELELHAEVVQRSQPLTPVIADAAGLGHAEVRHTFSVDLSQYELQEGDLLAVKARAVDGRPVPGQQEAWTSPRLVRVSSKAESVEKSELAQKQQLLRDLLAGIRENVQQDQDTTDTLRQATREAIDEQQSVDHQEQVAELNRLEQELQQKLDQLASVFDGHPLQRNIADATREVGTGPLEAAQQQFQQAEASPPQEQLEQLTKASDELSRADTQLGELLKRFDELAALEQDLMRLQELAEQAEQLSKDAAEFEQQAEELAANQKLNEEQRQTREAELDQQRESLQNDQQSLTNSLDRLLEERPEVLDAARTKQAERLKQLGEQASRLADQESRLAESLKSETNEATKSDVSEAEETAEGQQEGNAQDAEVTPQSDETGESSQDEAKSDPEDLVQRMQQLAEEASRLALETARAKGVETPAAEQAREFAEQALKAAEEANSGLLPDAAEAAEAASEAAQRTNRELHNPTDPAPPQLGEKSEELAERQQNLAEELRQQTESPEARQQAQTHGQHRMTEQTQSLAQQLQEIAERLQGEPLNEQEQAENASTAQEQTEQASAQMQQAQKRLEEGQSEEAAPHAETAAEALRQTAQQLGETKPPEEESPVPGEVGEQVADARRQLKQAGEQLRPQSQSPSEQSSSDQPMPGESATEESTEPPIEPSEESPPPPDEPSQGEQPEGEQPQGDEAGSQPGDMPGDTPSNEGQPSDQVEPTKPSSEQAEGQASQSMQQVAESLRQAAQQLGMGGDPSQEKGKPGEQSGEPSEGKPGDESGTAGKNPISLAELEAELRKMSKRNWGQLPGQIESELIQSTRKKPDSDYARQIRLYFEEVSRRRTASENLNDE